MLGSTAKRKVINRLMESGPGDQLTGILARVEHELLSAAVEMENAQGVETLQGDLPTVEERQQALKALLRALINDDFQAVWLEEVAPDLLDNPERAEQYVGMDADEWREQIQAWGEKYREAGASGSDGALAEHHVRDVFGVDIATFERRVVEFDRGEEAEKLFAGNFRAVRDSMRAVAEEGHTDE